MVMELDSALQEIPSSEKCYKILGHIMVSSSKYTLAAELSEKKEVNTLRLKNYLSQEEKLKRSIEDLQKEVIKEMKDHE